MKLKPVNNCRAWLLAISLTLSASIQMLNVMPAAAALDEKKDSSAFVEKMKKWEDEMSEKFRDTFKSLRKDNKESDKSTATASVDLREQKDSYTIRLNLPSRDLHKVDVKLEGDMLHIVAPAEDKAGRYEQIIALANVASDARPQIERKQKDSLRAPLKTHYARTTLLCEERRVLASR